MRYYILLVVAITLLNCSETQLVDYWKNPDIQTYSPTKILVVGLTDNTQARMDFEHALKQALEERGFEVAMGSDFKILYSHENKITLDELNQLEMVLIDEGFDTILMSSVIGVDNKIAYKSNYDGFDETYRRFKEDFLRYQDAYYNPDYYEEYTIYHAETSMYCICPTKARELIWKGYVDLTDPREIDKTVYHYVNLVMAALDELELIQQPGLNTTIKSEELVN
jgi:hypothetical protein